ncbi:MAG: PCRF domain-containing protein [Phycisphaerae bacterium]|jgi:peptide chain release factor 1|nr:PCRF domain-containing protein [Phycisphaerae bacterium]MBT6164931.1 PCRF domain-containing protein [Phycisphaerae bacterium]MBT7656905.1 PCRF domain-containing protein [Phycisphaerae bacterium]
MSERISDNVVEKLLEIVQQHDVLSAQLLEPDVLTNHKKVTALSIKKAAIAPLVEQFNAYQTALAQQRECEEVALGDDPELASMAKEELVELDSKLTARTISIQKQLVTAEEQSVGSVILEVRAGVGGDEATLWANDLEEMYRRFAHLRGWKIEELDTSKTIILSIAGEGVWTNLGFESGTHQVKRVPATETQGRIHTSTATVAVLPEPEEVEVELDPNDVKESITTSTGPGGQNVNKVATAVHLIHEPTGIEVRMQDTKSQAQNREKAWKLLRARLFDVQKAKIDAERAEARNSMIGSGNRAEKIRTYRYKDNLIVDHRISGNYNLVDVLSGNMQTMIDELIEAETARRLAEL